MNGYILLADGLRLDGTLLGPPRTVMGYVAANTAVVGFQEMITDPVYQGRILAFTYPEIGNVGVTESFSESDRVQVAALVVRVLSEFRSHCHSEDSLLHALDRADVPCLADVDTRGLAVHLRDHGEMAAAVAPGHVEPAGVRAALTSLARPAFVPPPPPVVPGGQPTPKVAVINLGIRRSQLDQLARCCGVQVFPYDANPRTILAGKPAGVFVSDGPGGDLPPAQTVATVKALLGQLPILACGLGFIVLGQAMGAAAEFLRRGHHGVNYPIRFPDTGAIEITHQQTSLHLRRDSLPRSRQLQVLADNVTDGTVAAIRSADGKAAGFCSMLEAPCPGAVNPHLRDFVARLGS